MASSGQCGLHLPTPPVLSHNSLYSTCSDAQLCQVFPSHRTFAHAVLAVWNILSSFSPRVNPVYSADLCSTSLFQRIPLIPVPAPSPTPARFSFLLSDHLHLSPSPDYELTGAAPISGFAHQCTGHPRQGTGHMVAHGHHQYLLNQ